MADDRPAPDLYAEDFYAWTQVQAHALRALTPKANSIDWERLIEEVEGLGSSQKNAVKSHLQQIIVHLLKLATSRALEPRLHWRVEIKQHRAEIALLMTVAIRREVEQELDALHKRAARLAQGKLDEYEAGADVDRSRRWSLAQLLGEADDPLDAAGL